MNPALDGQAKLLLFIFALFSFSSLLSGTFIPVYLWKQTGSYLHIALYILAQYLSSGLIFYLTGSVAKKGKKRLLMQLGCCFVSVFYILILWLDEVARYYIFPLGCLYGIGLGLYWFAYNVFYFEISNAENRDLFNGWQGILVAGSGIAAPWLASRVIVSLGEKNGYSLIFIVSLCLYIFVILASFKLFKRDASGLFEWRFPISAFFLPNSNWKYVGLSVIAQGVKEGMFLSLLPFIVFMNTSSEAEVGSYTLVTSLVALTANFIIGKRIRSKQRLRLLIIGAIGSWIAILFILVLPNLYGLLLFGGLSALIWPLFIIPFTSLIFDTIGASQQSVELKEEIIVFRELALMVGRLLGLIPFLIYSLWLIKFNLNIGWLMLLVGISPLLSVLFIKKLNNFRN